LIGVHMLTGLFSVDFNPLYALGPLAAVAVLLRVRAHLPPLSWSASWHAPAVGAAVFGMWLALEHVMAPDADGGQSLRAAVAHTPSPWAELWIAGRVLGSTLVVPLVEELAFRGYALRRLIQRDFTELPFDRFTWLSFIVSSLAFGALHQRWVAGTLAGMAFAAIQYRRGKLGDALVAHAVANGLISITVLGAGRWSLWA
jgi:CAAX prenyl protease-like protein